VDDPSRDLSLCRNFVGAGRRGPAGVAGAHVADGLTRAWQGDMSGAIEAFDQAIAIAPKSSQAYLNRSIAHAHDGDEERALEDADKAIRYAPGSATAYFNRSLVLRGMGKTSRARADERRAVELDASYEDILPR